MCVYPVVFSGLAEGRVVIPLCLSRYRLAISPREFFDAVAKLLRSPRSPPDKTALLLENEFEGADVAETACVVRVAPFNSISEPLSNDVS